KCCGVDAIQYDAANTTINRHGPAVKFQRDVLREIEVDVDFAERHERDRVVAGIGRTASEYDQAGHGKVSCNSGSHVNNNGEACVLFSGHRLKLSQEANVVFREQAQVVDSIAQHRDAFNAHAERKTCELFRVDVAVPQHVGMYHTRATDFHPAGAFAYRTARTFADQAADIHFSTGLCKREERRAEANLRVLAEHFAGEVIQRLFEIGKAYVAIDVKSFHLVEEAVRTGGYCFIAIHASGHDGADGRFCSLQKSYLNVGGMRPQQDIGIF